MTLTHEVIPGKDEEFYATAYFKSESDGKILRLTYDSHNGSSSDVTLCMFDTSSGKWNVVFTMATSGFKIRSYACSYSEKLTSYKLAKKFYTELYDDVFLVS